LSYRGTYRGPRAPQRTVPRWRLMLVVILTFWLFAVAVYTFSEWVAPALFSSAPSTTPSGINYGQSFGTPLIKTFGLWMTGVLLVLGPLVAVWKALERGGEAVMEHGEAPQTYRG